MRASASVAMAGVLVLSAFVVACDEERYLTVTGPCELALLDPQRGRPLTPPFRVVMSHDAGMQEAAIDFDGSGWSRVSVIRQPPNRPVPQRDEGVFEGAVFNDGRNGVLFDQVGVWRIGLVDERAGCRADFQVEVYPPGTTLTQ
jgi:hypothetical protein